MTDSGLDFEVWLIVSSFCDISGHSDRLESTSYVGSIGLISKSTVVS